MQKKTKKITLDGLGNTVGNLSNTVDKLSAKVDKLVSAMEVGFKRADERMEAGFNKAEENRESLARMMSNGFDRTNTELSRLEQGQENILLRLDSMAPKFEVKQLERRVKRLEDKAGIRHN